MTSPATAARSNRRLVAVALLSALAVFPTLLTTLPAQAATIAEVEPNRATSSAQSLPLTSTVSGTFGTSSDCNNFYDCDTYRLSVAEGGRLQLDLRFSSALGTDSSLDIDVLDSEGTTIYSHEVSASDYDGSTLRDLAMFVGSGTSYVQLSARVSSFSTPPVWRGQTYTLSATVAPMVSETENNSTTATADVVALGKTISGSSFNTDCNNFYDCDYYRVALASPTRLSVDFRFECDLGTSEIYEVSTYNTTGTRLSSFDLRGSDCAGDAMRNATVSAPAGNFYVRVYSRSRTITNGQLYRLTVSEVPFSDVPPNRAFAEEIAWLASSGITNGYSDGTFRPLGTVNRDAMAAFLYRFAGEPRFTPPDVSPFMDVTPSTPFYKEITWLESTGITGGFNDGTFRPLGKVNRDAMAAFLYRFAGEPAFTPPTVSPFSDVRPSTPFYMEITWLSSTGVTGGYSNGTFRALSSVNRDAMAAFLFRFDESGLGPA